ncbi:MAG TPA: uracil-DNA glycosylase family protein [Flavipsychrobacter sp.]
MMDELEKTFDDLCYKVQKCTLCSRMKDSQRILNRSVGKLSADIMFIGEAPGRLGADGSGIPFHGDKAGHNFEELLEYSGLNREDVYVTNAVLCNPKDENGNNATPNNTELSNCSNFLKQQIELIQPKVIVTLGANALNGISAIERHNFSLKEYVRTANNWYGRIVIPLYHPGQRAMMSRSMANQRSDYKFIADYLKKLDSPTKSNTAGKTSIATSLIIEYLFSKKNEYTYFALHKLFYLIEYKSFQKFGHRLTNAYIVRQKDGPYCTDLNIFKLKKAIPTLQSKPLSKTNILVYKRSEGLFANSLLNEYHLEENVTEIIDEVLKEHGQKSNAALKRTAYFTRPMRNILYYESEHKISMYNAPIIFSLR